MEPLADPGRQCYLSHPQPWKPFTGCGCDKSTWWAGKGGNSSDRKGCATAPRTGIPNPPKHTHTLWPEKIRLIWSTLTVSQGQLITPQPGDKDIPMFDCFSPLNPSLLKIKMRYELEGPHFIITAPCFCAGLWLCKTNTFAQLASHQATVVAQSH